MSQLVVPSHTYVTKIPIGRRVRELMKEKGMAFTISAMSTRMGVNRETLRKMLSGDRDLYTFELDKIADELSLSVPRILQKDIQTEMEELANLLSGSTNLTRATAIAEKFLSVAVGMTERCEAHIQMGKVFFEQQHYELAHEHRVEAHRLAQQIQESFNESRLLDLTTHHLMTSFTVRKDFANARQLAEKAKSTFDENPKRAGEIFYTLAMIAFESVRFNETREHLLQSLEYFQKSQDLKEIGKALHNVAFLEYKLYNYQQARTLFEESINILETYPIDKLFAIMDYSKVLYRVGQKSEAAELTVSSLADPLIVDIPELEAKFRLLHTIYSGEMSYAETVIESTKVSHYLKIAACKILMDHYKRQGMPDLLMKYYIIAEEYSLSITNRYREEDL